MLEEIAQKPTDVIITTTENAGIDLAALRQKHDAWLERGECPGPEEIGRIELKPEALAHLEQHLHVSYKPVHNTSNTQIAEDDETAIDQALPQAPMDSESRAILRDIYSKFVSLIEQDIQDTSLTRSSTLIWFGLYEGNDESHIDSVESSEIPSVRYLATVASPTTTFFHGTGFGPEFFDDSGSIKQDTAVPESVTPQAVPVGSVMRFLDNGDPHVAPTANEPVFRIFLSGTAILSRDKN